MSSYILFSRTSAAGFNRSTWGPGLGGTGGVSAPGNPDLGSAFNAELLTPAQLAAGNALFFDVSSGANATLTGLGTATPLFAPANTVLASNNVAAPTIDLSQSDANWNGIKNIEIRLDGLSDIRTVLIENIVDTRIKLGDDVCDLVPEGADGTPFSVTLLGVKRGEVDATLAGAPLNLQIDVWSNSAVGQNSFDIKGTVYDDVVLIGAGTVVGSSFGNKFNQTGFDGDGTYDGTFTKTFTHLGAGDDIFDSTNAVGDTLTGKEFRTVDKTWGGTGDDVIRTGFGNDKLYGDNGSGADEYADPADPVVDIADDFINEPISGPTVPTFTDGPINLGPLVDMGAYTISAVGGDLLQLKTGLPATRAGGLGILSASDPISSLEDVEIDSRDGDEAIVIEFKGGAHSVELGLTAVFVESRQDNKQPYLDAETVFYDVLLADGSSFTASAEATGPAVPGALTITIDESDTGGQLIEKVTLRPEPNDFHFMPFSDFYLSTVSACVPTPGAPGDDVLVAGAGVDFLEGNQDNGGFLLADEVCRDFILGAPLSGTSEDTGFLLIESIGGDLAKLGDGATFGGLTVHSPSDQALAGGTDFFTNEIDAVGENALFAEGVRFTFDGPGVTGFHIDLNMFFDVTFFEDVRELADFKVTLEDGSEVAGILEATSTTAPGAFEFAFGLGDSGGELITGFEISAHRAPRLPFSEFTIAEFCYDGQLTIAGGDVLFLGDDNDKDTVNFNDGDGVDTVFEFDTAKDVVRIEGNEAHTLSVVVDAANGVGTLIEHGGDGDGIFLVGVVDTASIQIITF